MEQRLRTTIDEAVARPKRKSSSFNGKRSKSAKKSRGIPRLLHVLHLLQLYLMAEKTQRHLIGGFLGGLSSSVALQPLDLVKTRLQQSTNGSIRSTLKELTSIKQLWRGTLPSALRTSVGSALYLSTLNIARSYLSTSKTKTTESSALPKLSMTANLLAGGLSRGFVGWLTMPITVIKVRYESTLYNYKSLWEAVKSIRHTEGVKGFFNGFVATAARDAPYAGLYVLLYEQSKEKLPLLLPANLTFNMSTSAMINSISAFSAASLATTITAPFDTIKTRMQLQPKKFTTFLKSANLIWREGPLRLLDGLSLRLTRKAFSAGIAWGIYEELIKIL